MTEREEGPRQRLSISETERERGRERESKEMYSDRKARTRRCSCSKGMQARKHGRKGDGIFFESRELVQPSSLSLALLLMHVCAAAEREERAS